MVKRAYGSGRIFVKHGSYYGSWRLPSGSRATRKLGPVRKGNQGLSKTEAEARLREMILTATQRPRTDGDDLTVRQLGRLLVARLETTGRKPSHVEGVRYHLSKHLEPLLGDVAASDVSEADVRRVVDRMLHQGLAPKTVRNVCGTLHSVLGQVVRDNPCDMAKLPEVRPFRGDALSDWRGA